MTFVEVTLPEGQTAEQKRTLCDAIAATMAEHTGASADAVSVNLLEESPENDGGPLLFGIGHMLLRTRDLERSLAFYTDVLGLTIRKRGQARDGGPLVATNEGIALTTGRADGESPIEHLAFRGVRIEALAARARELGVPIVDGPAVTAEYGTSIYVEDPDGNRIEIYGEG